MPRLPCLPPFDLAHKTLVTHFFSGKGEKTRPFTLVSQAKGEEGPPDRNLVFRKIRGQERRTGREKESLFLAPSASSIVFTCDLYFAFVRHIIK